VALGVRADGQKVLLAIKNMGGESEAAWRALLHNLVARSLKTPGLVIVDGGSGLDKALAALWGGARGYVAHRLVNSAARLVSSKPFLARDGAERGRDLRDRTGLRSPREFQDALSDRPADRIGQR
jgi:Transposase, Mutator family